MVKLERVNGWSWGAQRQDGWLLRFDWGHLLDLLGRGGSTPPLGQPSPEWTSEA